MIKPITDYRSPITDHRLLITDYRSPITDHRLPITDYFLTNTNQHPSANERPSSEATNYIGRNEDKSNFFAMA
jgi:hypothetical protein